MAIIAATASTFATVGRRAASARTPTRSGSLRGKPVGADLRAVHRRQHAVRGGRELGDSLDESSRRHHGGPARFGGDRARTAFELSIVSIGYWNGDLSPATFSTTCPSTDLGSQELTLRVHAGDGSFDRQMMIVKRAP